MNYCSLSTSPEADSDAFNISVSLPLFLPSLLLYLSF